MKRMNETLETVLLYGCATLVVGGLTLGLTAGIHAIPHLNKSVYQAQVRHVEAVSDEYLVFTELENGEKKVFENEDNWIAGKFDSSDIYNDLELGQDYCFKTIGWRIPFLSQYENIIDYRPIGQGEVCDY